MTLQRLAYILPQTSEEEAMVKEIFEQRAKVSTYQTLTTIDVKLGWQEAILQKYIDEKRETMAPENPAALTPEEEANLDANVITKEKELELQAKLDARNKKQKGLKETTSEVTGTDVEIPISEVSTSEMKVFCDTCDAKGPIKHKNTCPKSKK